MPTLPQPLEAGFASYPFTRSLVTLQAACLAEPVG